MRLPFVFLTTASAALPLLLQLLLVLLLVVTMLLPPPVTAVRKLQIAVPLQALTIWDPEFKERVAADAGADDDAAEYTDGATRRARFLPRFRAGLEAEAAVRRQLLRDEQLRDEQQEASLPLAEGGGASAARSKTKQKSKNKKKDWAARAAASDRERAEAHERLVERAYDEAVAQFDQKTKRQMMKHTKNKSKKKNANQFQFVGVVHSAAESSSSTANSNDGNDGSNKPPITWYARPKPAHAQWSIRLVHVNRAAVLHDLYKRGKIDVFARYEHTGQRDPQTGQPVIHSHYSVRERSWKNLWNFNIKHLFTDSSGMYWRERRLPAGLYTDGGTVYEASYRYRDGRNGMHRISSLADFRNSRSVPASQKEKIVKRLEQQDAPDVVLEE